MATDYRDVGIELAALDRWGATANLRAYGGVGDDSTADDDALDLAYAALPDYGGAILFPQGRWVFTREHAFLKPVVLVGSGPRHGKQFTASTTEHGSYIILGDDIDGALFRWTKSAADNILRGCGIRDLSILGSSRGYTVDAAIHAEACDQFALFNVDIESVAGRAIRVTRCVKGLFVGFDVYHCGDTSKSAVDLDPANSGDVQGCTFAQGRVESCYSAPYFSVGENAQTNKFDHLGFECEPATSATLQTHLSIAGEKNQFGLIHCNRTDTAATVTKLEVTGHRNTFAAVLFAGLKSDSAAAGDLVVSGLYNQFGTIEIEGVSAGTEDINCITLSGAGNTIGSVTGTRDGGFVLSGAYCTIEKYTSFTGAGQVVLSGANTRVGDALIQGNTLSGSPLVTLSGARAEAKVRAIACASVSEGVLITSSGRLLPGSYLNALTAGHGVRVTGALGCVDGVDIDTVGKHGIFVDAGDPRSISNNHIKSASGASAGTYSGISLEASTNHTTGGVCNGNRIEQGSNTHAASIFVTDNAGSPRYDYWTFVGNTYRSGGAISVSTGNNILGSNRS
jgi:hypothetical protein